MLRAEKIGKGSATLAAGTLQPMDLANGKQVIRVTKVIPYITYRFTSSDRMIREIYYIDSEGKSIKSFFAKEVEMAFKTYNNGIITSLVKCNIYLQPHWTVTSKPEYTWPE